MDFFELFELMERRDPDAYDRVRAEARSRKPARLPGDRPNFREPVVRFQRVSVQPGKAS